MPKPKPKDQMVQSTPTKTTKVKKSRTRLPHNIIERQYRYRLNSQIESLRHSVPAVWRARNVEDESNSEPVRLPSKAIIISAAITYIKALESEISSLQGITRTLQEQMEELQKLVHRNDGSWSKPLTSLRHKPSDSGEASHKASTHV
jgi:hypothetical protein